MARSPGDVISMRPPVGWGGVLCRAERLGVGLILCAAIASPASAGKPEWVERNGLSSAHPSGEYLTGYGIGRGKQALAEAKQAAAADLARLVSVRIESEISDFSQEKDGEQSYRLAAVTRSTTDVRLSDLHYEPAWEKRGRVYVLAWIKRADAAATRAAQRDRALAELRICLTAARREKESLGKAAALAGYESCRRPIAEALQHDAVVHALRGGGGRDQAVFEELIGASREIDHEIEAILRKPAGSLASATDAMALQLARQGVSTSARIVVSHLSYGTTNLSSSFGRRAGIELERALASAARPLASGSGATPARATSRPPDLAISGVYLENDDRLRLSVTAREIESGRLVGSAESMLPISALPAGVEIKPSNFEEALRDQRILAEGGLLSSDLQLQVWTDKGRGGVLYTEREELKLYLRVNQPAWIRLLYVLQNGAKVPIDHAYYIDEEKVNMVVEYPDSFEVVPPFGIEMIHATAFTEKPPRLATTNRLIGGVRYDVVADGLDSVVRTRGLARRSNSQLAEDFVTVTTTPR